MPLWGLILTVVAAIILTAVITALYVRMKDRRKLEYMLDAFEDGEYNFRFRDEGRFNKALNRIKWVVDRRRQQNEEESWSKLIRVLTHEIMNTVSPIASLSDALSKSVGGAGEHPGIDIKSGLETISSSSRNLIKFVESYRELAGVARPVKKALMVDELVGNVLELTREDCIAASCTCTYKASDEDILIYADESQISRILINLIKNAVQAGAHNISIVAGIDEDEQTFINVTNDGAPISPSSRDQIFIPFYTTKANGSGIGLSLSRQIMLAHNGRLDLTRSDSSGTRFTLIFR
ncbi:MAG: HAMP domain-containing sensor histidine kinase [Bacteroidales bacterium]|nr:HAMP domain-containing sensor histidine kinase [Bacteroidales bacterium]